MINFNLINKNKLLIKSNQTCRNIDRDRQNDRIKDKCQYTMKNI